jgi:hypothetical protein
MTTMRNTHSGTAKRSSGWVRRLVAPIAALALAAPLLCWAAPAGADASLQPKDTHCPDGFDLHYPTDFAPTYLAFMTGQDANGNGLVCVKQFTQAAANALDPKYGLPVGSPLYLARDDSIVTH